MLRAAAWRRLQVHLSVVLFTPIIHLMRFTLPVPVDFDFARAVCSHGWFVLAPNRWDPPRQQLETVLAAGDTRALTVRVRGKGRRILMEAACDPAEVNAVGGAIRRMLRLEEDFTRFHAVCRRSESHRGAAKTRFGRLLRGACLFEDMVKVICTCNVTWRQTVAMVERLVAGWGVPTAGGESSPRSFPTPGRLARATLGQLRTVARLGYRAEFVSRLARQVDAGRLDLDSIERFSGPTEELHRRLRQIHGIGPYAASNLCMLLGRYDCLAIDTELVRFLRERHPRRRFTPASIHRYFAAWHPYEFLAYWWELWDGYEQRHGPAHAWQPDRTGPVITRAPG